MTKPSYDELEQALELVEWFYRFPHVGEDAQCAHVVAFMQRHHAALREQLATARQAVWEEVTTRLLVRLNRVVEDGELPVIEHELEAWIRWCREQAQKEAP